METTAVQIHTARGVVEIHSCYGPPGSVLSEADFRAVFGVGHPTILARDLNCKHKSWNSKTTNTRGRQLAKIANKYDLTVEGPEEDTHIHIPTGSTDVLDIAVVKNVTTPYHLETVNDLTSDHLPVVMTLSLDKNLAATTTHTTNWLEFEKQLDPRPIIIKRTSDIDGMVRQFEEDVKKAMAAATKVKTISHRERIPDHIKVKIFKKKKLYKEHKRTLHPHTKTLLNSITNEIKEDIAELYNLQWEKKIEELEQDQSALWKMAKAFKPKSGKIPPLKSETGIINDPRDKTEEFANYFEDTFLPNKPASNDLEKFANAINGLARTDYGDELDPPQTTAEELLDIIKTLKNRKAPGRDGITNAAIKHLHLGAIDALRDIINGVLRYQHFPQTWKYATVIVLHKTGKPKDSTDGYRSISLLPGLSKVLENVIQRRLLEVHNAKNYILAMNAGSKLWREASSIILVARTSFTPPTKPVDINYKLLMLKRSSKSRAMPGSYVFPGGVLCQADISRDWLKLYESFGFKLDMFDKLDPKENRPKLYHSQNSNELPKYLSLRIGAIRETFEESGVLICRSYKINHKEHVAKWASSIEEPELLKWQYTVHSNPELFIQLCRKYEVYPDVWALKEWSNWVTPTLMPSRFDTAFFLAAFEKQPSIHAEETEVEQLEWASPTDYLIRNMNKEITLAPPQVYELSRLRNFKKIDDLLRFANERANEGIERYFPMRIKTREGLCTLLPGDDLYLETGIHEEKMAYMEDLPASSIQNRIIHKSPYHNEIRILNLQPKCNHIAPLPLKLTN
ncbi:hypothetical protein Trydic_g12938 [Trypoxylus dichotomus]